MAAVERLHHTGFTVSSLDRSVAFYRDLLGCEVIAAQEKEGGYLAAIVGYPDAHVRMAHLRVPGGEHVVELFEYLAPAGDRADVAPRMSAPRTSASSSTTYPGPMSGFASEGSTRSSARRSRSTPA